MTNIIYSQVYTAVAKYLLRLDRDYPQAADLCDPFYTVDIHQRLVDIAIYESKGFKEVVKFGLTQDMLDTLWADKLSGNAKLSEAIAMVGAGMKRGPWDTITSLEAMPLIVIFARLHWGVTGAYHETNDFYSVVGAFKLRNPTPTLHLSPEDEGLLDHTPGTKQMRLPV